MDTEQFLQNVFESIDREHIYIDYSGRGMYGKTCVGITASSQFSAIRMLFEAVKETAEQWDNPRMALDVMDELLAVASADSLGREVIVYFPGTNVRLEEDEEDLDEDE